MKGLKVMFDVDGVLADFVKGFTELAHHIYDTPVETTMEHKVWDWFPGMDAYMVQKVWATIEGHDAHFWADLEALPSSKERQMVKQLTEAHGAQVYFVSNRQTPTALEQTRVWLRNWLNIMDPNVILVGAQGKGYIAKGLSADFAIDDKIGNAVYVGYESRETKSYLLERPYNTIPAELIGRTVRRVSTLTPFLLDVSRECRKRRG